MSGHDAALLTDQAFRFDLDVTTEQAEFLGACAGASRFWFNQGLALVKDCLDKRAAGEQVTVPWSYKRLCGAFKGDEVKDELAPWRSEVAVGAYQAGLEALGKALQNFSRGRREGRHVGFPEFRAKGHCHESIIFQRPRLPDNRHVDLDRRVGLVRVKESLRKLTRLLARDPNARVLRSTVQLVNGGWVISFTVSRSLHLKLQRARKPRAVIGVDVGLTRLATLSTGEFAVNARPLSAALSALRRMERQLDRQRRANNPANYHPDGRAKKGCKNWVRSKRMMRTRERFARLHKRVADLRRRQAHLLTSALVREFGIIGVETLAVKNLMRNKRLARHIADVGWGMILAQLAYKMKWSAGGLLVAADRFFPSSKTCSTCGTVKAKLSLSERVFTCEASRCGLVMDRDLNAALNLARMAQEHAQAEGIPLSYVARVGRFTTTARGGQVSLARISQLSPTKREDSPVLESSHGRREASEADEGLRCEALAAA